jgi:hypothetical protein
MYTYSSLCLDVLRQLAERVVAALRVHEVPRTADALLEHRGKMFVSSTLRSTSTVQSDKLNRSQGMDGPWRTPTTPDVGLDYLSEYLYFMLTAALVIRNEEFAPLKNRSGRPMNMDQFRVHFGTTRIPAKGKDDPPMTE